ncbi:nucleotidyltransferase substrate binding protein [Candidatus Bipolaricaulota bacterium]|nr:nucleotidyltransferase substrate binding protein [Candidatus Bipolaricaulota bacterium]
MQHAVERLADALDQPKNEYLRDAAIQRFEFTFELAWKVMKTYVECQGLEARSPRESIRMAFKTALIPEDVGWLAMIELRNLASHTYDEALAERIYAQLPDMLSRFRDLLAHLQTWDRDDGQAAK